jgi:serine/threonine protein kinase
VDDIKVAIKEIRKERLTTTWAHEFARNELVLHYSMSKTSCLNITKVYDYYEDDLNYYLVMECSNEADFFEEMLENVNIS